MKKIILGFIFATVATFSYANVKIIVPFSAGGMNDRLARYMQTWINTDLQIPVTLEYKLGAGGDIATSAVASVKTKEVNLLVHSSSFTIHASMPATRYNWVTDLVPVSYAGHSPLVLVKNPNNNINIRDHCNSPTKHLTIGASGVNTTTFIHGELLSDVLKNCITVIPFKGNADVVQALLGGHVDLGFVFVNDSLPLIVDKKLDAVAVVANKRIKTLPGIPTLDETGIVINWFRPGMFVMANRTADPELLAKVQASIIRMLQNNISDLEKIGLTVDLSNINDVQDVINAEIKRFQSKPFSKILKPQ
jgi:tripartite-type tricarboxylate transporter receptor subunit TctC